MLARCVFLGSCLFLAACAGGELGPKTAAVLRAIEPETVGVSITDPNLFNGPIYNTPPKGQQSPANSHFGSVGGMVTLTYRLKPIHIERTEVQPVSIVRATPVLTPYGNSGH